MLNLLFLKRINQHFTKITETIMKVVFYFLFSFLLLTFSLKLKSQEMLGVTMGNYSGTTSILVNPAMMTNTHNFLDVNILSGDIFLHNNSIYIHGSDYNLVDAIGGKELPEYGKENKNYLYYHNTDLKNMAVSLRLMGPSAMFQYGDHAFGLSTGARVFTTGNYMPWEMPVFGFESLKYKTLHNIQFNDNNTDLQANAWGEIGLSYAYNLIKYYDQKLTVGITVKYLMGYSGAYVDVDNIEYMVQNDSVINITNLNAKVAYSLPIDYDNNDFPNSGSNIRGKGFGFDIGAVYVKRKSIDNNRWNKICEQQYDDYIYRIGVSILDIGSIKYKENAQVHSFKNVNALWENYDDLAFDNLNQVVQEISNVFYNDPNASLTGSSFKVGLPTALSIQADYHFSKNIYFGSFWIHPLKFNGHTLRRPANISFTPRYETKYLEFSLPISLYEYQYPRVGASVRFYFLTIGTERLGSWIGTGDLSGMDFYFSVKFAFEKGKCRQQKNNACYNGEYGYSPKQKRLFRKR
jgi:hypothetical protein